MSALKRRLIRLAEPGDPLPCTCSAVTIHQEAADGTLTPPLQKRRPCARHPRRVQHVVVAVAPRRQHRQVDIPDWTAPALKPLENKDETGDAPAQASDKVENVLLPPPRTHRHV